MLVTLHVFTCLLIDILLHAHPSCLACCRMLVTYLVPLHVVACLSCIALFVHCLASWSHMIEVKVPYMFCAFHLILNCTLDSFGHHALKYAIDGPRVGNYTPLSLKHDKGCCCKHCLVNALSYSVCPLLQRKEQSIGIEGWSAIFNAGQLQVFGRWIHIWSMTYLS